MSIVIVALIFIGVPILITWPLWKKKKQHTIEGKIRNLRVCRPLYKDSTRRGTRFDFQVWGENNSGRDVTFGIPSVEVSKKTGECRHWNLPMLGTVSDGGYVLLPSSRAMTIRLYWDDVGQEEIDIRTLSVAVKDDTGKLHVFIVE